MAINRANFSKAGLLAHIKAGRVVAGSYGELILTIRAGENAGKYTVPDNAYARVASLINVESEGGAIGPRKVTVKG